MEKILEMEVWSAPGCLAEDTYAYSLKSRFHRETGISSNVFLALSSVPDQDDIDNLSNAFSNRILLETDFYIFCKRHRLSLDRYDILSACRFLEYSYGVALAWLHIPADGTEYDCLKTITHWARLNNLVVVEPYNLYCVVFF